MDDVIKLVSQSYTKDDYGNLIETDVVERQVFCQVRSVGRSDFYAAAQADLHPEYVFILSHYMDYQNEPEILYTDWTGEERRFVIVRTYRTGDALEITVEEKVGRLRNS